MESAEIVASIRRRIASGELKPGDRVPSTREITRRWGVAMATATRVLATLRQEGLVVARPGIGTTVASGVPAPSSSSSPSSLPSSSPPARPVPPEIDRADVLRTAIAIADAEGSAAVSMRRVATELGVATMSLYRHVAGKDDLLERMVDAAFGEHRLTSPPPRDWVAALETGARTLWRIFRRHPWVAQVMSLTRPQVTPNALAFTEWVLSALMTAGWPPRHTFQVHVTVFSHVRGLAVSLEPEAVARQETGLTHDEFAAAQDTAFAALLATGDYPVFGEIAASADFDLDLDEQFEFGLRHLLAGLAGLPVAGRQTRLR